jgi:hypothetical protein
MGGCQRCIPRRTGTCRKTGQDRVRQETVVKKWVGGKKILNHHNYRKIVAATARKEFLFDFFKS